jgi:folate-binding protein YgfZ
MKLFQPEAAFLRVTGDDRLDFVHGLVSNQVKQLPADGTSISLVLNHRGQALAQLRTLRFAGHLLLVIEDGAGRFVQEEFESHIIFDQVGLEDVTQAWRLLSVQGEGAAAAVSGISGQEVPEAGFFAATDSGLFLTRSRRSLAGGVDLIVPAAQAGAVTQQLLAAGATPGSREELDLARVQAGIATAAGEGGEGVLPQEAGLEGFVSYRKGCYLGQEIMARIEARGNLRRQLAGLRLAALPEAGQRDIRLEGRTVGRLGTVAVDPGAGVLALAVLRSDVSPQATLEVGGTSARISPLPSGSPAPRTPAAPDGAQEA